MPASSESTAFDGKALVKTLPVKPGVYRMLNEAGEVLYVGKARELRKRVGSYFNRQHDNPRIATMVAQIADIQISVTRTEAEALLLEDQLIKSLKPHYNVLLRDDKSFPYIYLSSKDEFPRLAFHRGPQRLPGEYFGPFPSAYTVRNSLKQMQKLFRVRQCEDTFFRNRTRPCLQYQIQRCTAPCVELISESDYARDVRHARLFLNGSSHKLIDELGAAMEAASQVLEYERAAQIRDQIATLKRIQAQQYVTGATGDIDVVGMAREGGSCCIQVVFFRQGRNLGDRSFFPKNSANRDDGEILQAFLTQYYLAREIPTEIILDQPVPDAGLLTDVFGQRAGRKVRLVQRPRTERSKWLSMARDNAQIALKTQLASHAGVRRRLDDLVELLQLTEAPQRMECFDISHSRGEATVASCVVFDSNGPLKSDYRRFIISGIEPGDDYAAMRQALERRYRRLKAGEGKIPELLFIDGGKGQVRQAMEVLEELQIDEIRIVGVAKGPERKAGEETLILADEHRELHPGPASLGLSLIQWVRDEAHRFAITGHRQRRGKARQQSTLEKIPGVGPKRRKILLTHFGGLQGLKAAGVEEISVVEGINRELAHRIYDALHPDL